MTQEEFDIYVNTINYNNDIVKSIRDKILEIALNNDIPVENYATDPVTLLNTIGETLTNPNSGQEEPTNQDYVEYYRHDITIPNLPIVGSYMNGLLTKEGFVSEYTTIYTARKTPYENFGDFWADVGMDTLILSGTEHYVDVSGTGVMFTLSEIIANRVNGTTDNANTTVSGNVLNTTEIEDSVDIDNPIRVYYSQSVN